MAKLLPCLRGLLLGFVVILGFSGVIIAAGCGIFLYQLHEYPILTPASVDGPPASLLGLGILTCITAWFVWHFDYSSKSQIVSIAALIILVGLMEISVGVWAIVRHQQIYMLPDKSVQKAVVSLYDQKNEDVWHRMHVRVSCCGVNGVNEDFRQKHKSVPWSCCYESSESEDRKTCERGCHHPLVHRTRSILLFTFLLALGSVILKACIVATAWCYAKAIKEGMERRRRQMMMASRVASQAAAAAAAARPSGIEERNLSPLVEKSGPLGMI